MKKLFSFVFLAVFLFNVCGFYFIFDFRQAANKNCMESRLSTFPIQANIQITVPLSALQHPTAHFRQTGEDEIMYDGKMYDVSSSSIRENGNITFYCLSDSNEDLLKAQLANDVLCTTAAFQENPSQHPGHKVLLKDLVHEYLPAALLTFREPDFSQAFSLIAFQLTFRAPFFKVLSPPPKVA